jgi:hypothetical protein
LNGWTQIVFLLDLRIILWSAFAWNPTRIEVPSLPCALSVQPLRIIITHDIIFDRRFFLDQQRHEEGRPSMDNWLRNHHDSNLFVMDFLQSGGLTILFTETDPYCTIRIRAIIQTIRLKGRIKHAASEWFLFCAVLQSEGQDSNHKSSFLLVWNTTPFYHVQWDSFSNSLGDMSTSRVRVELQSSNWIEETSASPLSFAS